MRISKVSELENFIFNNLINDKVENILLDNNISLKEDFELGIIYGGLNNKESLEIDSSIEEALKKNYSNFIHEILTIEYNSGYFLFIDIVIKREGYDNVTERLLTYDAGELSVTEKMISVLNDDDLFFLFINEFSKVYKDTVGEFNRDSSSSLYLKDMRIKKATIKKVLKDIASGVKLDFDTIIEYNT